MRVDFAAFALMVDLELDTEKANHPRMTLSTCVETADSWGVEVDVPEKGAAREAAREHANADDVTLMLLRLKTKIDTL